MSFAARLFAAAEHELDLDLDSEGPADAEDGSGGSEAGPSSVVDLSLLPLSALMRYVRHYSLSVPPECSKARLVTAVEEHFCSTVVDEARPPVPSPPHAPPAPPIAPRPRPLDPGSARSLVISCAPTATPSTTVPAMPGTEASDAATTRQ